MKYIYDIILNFNERLYEFYDGEQVFICVDADESKIHNT